MCVFYILLISAMAGSLTGPIPNLLAAVTVTTTVLLKTPSGSDGINVSVVIDLLTFIIIPL